MQTGLAVRFARKKYEQQFARSFEQLGAAAQNILVFHGEDGLGKTELMKSLEKANRDQCVVLNGSAMKRHNDLSMERSLELLFCELARDGLELRDFGWSYAYYLNWAHPGQAYDPSDRQGRGDAGDIISTLGDLFGAVAQDLEKQVPFAGTMSKLAWFALRFMENPGRQKEILQQLNDCAEPYEFLELLPKFLMQTLRSQLEDQGRKVAILIDGYEDLLDQNGRCLWLEEMLAVENPAVLWVLFAKQEISGFMAAQQVKIEPLTYEESLKWLEEFGIEDEVIAGQIAITSKGIPADLKLRVEMYRQFPQSQARSREEVLQQLAQGWDAGEAEILKVLAFARTWDVELVSAIVQNRQLGEVETRLKQILALPFVEELEDQLWRLYPLMSQHLQARSTLPEQKLIHQWLYEFGRSQHSKQADLGRLVEGVYHGLRGIDPEVVAAWTLEQIVVLQAESRHTEAIALIQQIAQMGSQLSAELGAIALMRLGMSQVELGQTEKAIETLEQARSSWALLQKAESAESATVEFYLGRAYLQSERVFDAGNAAERSKRLRMALFGEESLEVVETLDLLAQVFDRRNELPKAIELNRQALWLYSGLEERSTLRLIKLMQTQANLMLRQDRLDEALRLCQETIKLGIEALGERHPEVIVSRGMLGFVYLRMGERKLQAAYEELSAALELGEEVLGMDHPQVLNFLRFLGAVCRKAGKYDAAERFAQRHNMSIQAGEFENTVARAFRLNEIGLILYQKGEYGKVEPLWVRSLSIREQQLGKTHPDTAISLNNLAVLYKEQGRYSEAEPLSLKALAVREQYLGEQHPDTANSLNNLALLYESQKRYSEAEPLYLRALSIREQQLGKHHLDTAITLNNLALLYESQKRYSEAEPLYLRALAIREQQLGKHHPDTAQSLNNLATIYKVHGRFDEAEALLTHSLKVRMQLLGKEHPYTANTLSNLAEIYKVQARFDEAESLLVQAVEIAKKALGIDHPDTQIYIRNLELLQQKMRLNSSDSP
ncbi:MAG: tetratricopeptide repeat protein [Leptolyngbya sp. UWPOB_LEPTO1]|uniref:tetratricopeptide repeat protein n=1 Tax=Leptolyngbya sp. UWPOB_LEPTO1 TaxID=2815653 RepID=UPI001ACDDFE3|nr:tetratricopeptide repeat protein [Leptolyngbya sp. UWPOB_LEPTO1]MBN8560267.1 tetratricopeptide repeat protein [Leptolyngbya sp. UWPOB_LEPTO1]